MIGIFPAIRYGSFNNTFHNLKITAKESAKILDKIGPEPMYYHSKIEDFHAVEGPEVFGQHINAEISSEIIKSNALIQNIISLSPQTGTKAGGVKDDKILAHIKELFQKLPDEIDLEEVN